MELLGRFELPILSLGQFSLSSQIQNRQMQNTSGGQIYQLLFSFYIIFLI